MSIKYAYAIFLILCFVSSNITYAADKILFYMHGSEIHKHGVDTKFGKRVEAIVEHLRSEGFNVIFEFRPNDDLEADANLTAQLVKDKIKSGTAPEDIIISGFSYGALVSLTVAEVLQNEKLNIALFSGCPENLNRDINIDFTAVKGRVLSIYDVDDHKFGPCKGRLTSAADFSEHEIESGHGHKGFRFSKSKYLDMWVPVLKSWAM